MRPIRLLVAVPAAVLLLAGCGDDTTAGSGNPAASGSASASATTGGGNGVAALGAEEILKKAEAALRDAGSVRIKGDGGSGTERFAIDLRYADDNSTGTLGINGQTIELRKLGQTVYLKGSREFWASSGGEGVAQLLTGKWLKTPLSDKRFGGLSELTDLDEAADGLLDPDGTITKGEQKTVNGVPCIGLVSSGKDGGTLWVATTGEPYPVRIEPDPKSDEEGAIDFTGYGETVTVEAPPADQVVDVSKLPSGN
ncbi:MAG TPA: hypothetical protein VE547_22285 [Mycobacteriales bacterium]|nr:hypothetical protein [Mycobacteriales bacterium]